MSEPIAPSSARFTTFRVFGTIVLLFAALIVILLVVRPDMVMSAMRAFMDAMP